jgi:hypothetical protein
MLSLLLIPSLEHDSENTAVALKYCVETMG